MQIVKRGTKGRRVFLEGTKKTTSHFSVCGQKDVLR